MEKVKFLCKQCGNPLQYEDTMDTEGSLEDGWFVERQLWSCEHCQVDYIIEQKGYFTGVQTLYFEKA